MIEPTNLLAETGRIKVQLDQVHNEARRLTEVPGGTPAWPAEAVAEAEELLEALAEARQRAERLYRLTPAPWKVRETEMEEARRG